MIKCVIYTKDFATIDYFEILNEFYGNKSM